MSTASARVLRDSWIITRRDLEHWVAQPAPVVISLLFPVIAAPTCSTPSLGWW